MPAGARRPIAARVQNPAMSFYEELREPDQTTLRFTSLGFATSHVMRPEASAKFLRSLVALPLSDAVDDEVAQTVARLRAVFYHGLFDYDLFTAASDLAYLAVEGALPGASWLGTAAACHSSSRIAPSMSRRAASTTCMKRCDVQAPTRWARDGASRASRR